MFNKSSGVIYRIKNILLYFILLTVFLTTSIRIAFTDEEKDKKENKPEKKQEQIIIPNPASFIEENLVKSYERLKKLRDEYENCCGSLLFDYLKKGADPKEIAKNLPKPKTLRFHLSYEEKEDKIPKIDPERLAYYRETTLFPNGVGFADLSDNKTGEYRGYFAADKDTSALLNIKNTAVIKPMVWFGYLTKELYYVDGLGKYAGKVAWQGIPNPDSAQIRLESPVRLKGSDFWYEKCCSKAGTQDCTEHIQVQLLRDDSYNYFSLPQDLLGKLGVKLTIPEGTKLKGDGILEFTSPGIKTITIQGKKGIERANPTNCLAAGSFSTSSQVMTGYRSLNQEDVKTAKFTVIKFLKFGISGLDFEDESVKKPFVDYFLPAKQKDIFSTSSTLSSGGAEKEPYVLEINADPRYDLKGFVPKILVDIGEQEEKILDISNFPISVRTLAKESGPILPEEKGRLSYVGGIGSSVIVWQLGKLESDKRTVKHRFTVNLVEVQIDPEMKDGTLSQGGSYKVKLLVLGDANMVMDYNVVWGTQGPAKWEQGNTLFKKEGNFYVTENTLTTDVFEKWEDAIGKEVKFSAIVNYSPAVIKTTSDMLLDMLSETKSGGKKQKISQNVFSFRGTCKITLPVVEGIKLLVEYPNEKPQEINEIDIFYPSISPQVRLIPYFILKGVKEPKLFKDIKGSAGIQIEFRSTNPYAAMVGSGGRIISNATYPLETEIYAKINGYSNMDTPEGARSLEIKGDKIFSNSIWVNINRVMLTSSPDKDGKKIYKLTVSGAGDMTKYSVVWKMDNTTHTTQFKEENYTYITSLSTSLKMQKVQIVKDKIILAELRGGNIQPQSVVRLLPSDPPATTIKRTTGPDMGELEKMQNMDECVKKVTFWVDYLGFEAGTTPENYCKQEREKKRQEQERIKAQNKYIKELEQKGLELIVFSDAMKVGAVITGLPKEYWNRSSCRWLIKPDATGLYLDKDITPVEMSSEGLGGCFNIVRGLEKNFDPNAVLKVELVLDTGASNIPLFVKPGKYVGTLYEF